MPSGDSATFAPGTGPGLRQSPQAPKVTGVEASGSRLPALLVMLGGAAVVIGTFLPWLQATGPGGTVTENGLKIGTWGTLILGLLAAWRGLALYRPGTYRAQYGSPLLSGVLIAILVALRWSYLQDVIRNTEAASPGVTAGIGIGLLAVIAGAALIIVGGLMSSAGRRR